MNKKEKKNSFKKMKIAVAMSGGVDSSVAAKLLKEQGHELIGIFLHFWKDEKSAEKENKCCSLEALEDARRVCRKIGIPLYTMNFSEIFKKEVVDNFLHEYECGRTPNPCVKCNKLVKLGLLIKKAEELGFPHVATGHYVRLKNDSNKIKLFRAKDDNKDQSYFLWKLNQEELKHVIFPLAELTKPEVRKLAEKFSLSVAKKRESQEICFIPEKNHNEFLKRNLKLHKGDIMTLAGKKIGEHQGLPLYTIGQRKGIELGGTGPYYVVKADYKNNILYVTDNSDDPVLFRSNFNLIDINWTSGQEPSLPLKSEIVIRYRHNPIRCELTKSNNKYLVNLAIPQRAITPGQSAVFYSRDEVIGGGIIDFVS